MPSGRFRGPGGALSLCACGCPAEPGGREMKPVRACPTSPVPRMPIHTRLPRDPANRPPQESPSRSNQTSMLRPIGRAAAPCLRRTGRNRTRRCPAGPLSATRQGFPAEAVGKAVVCLVVGQRTELRARDKLRAATSAARSSTYRATPSCHTGSPGIGSRSPRLLRKAR
jgi:hypothetical protein